MPLSIGSLIHNRYRIEKVIAQGGMGAIYRAIDESLGVVVALKENLITTEDSSRQFHREATILAGLRHPNLPRVTDHFTISGQGQYLVMDFIEGEDLKQKMARLGRLPEKEVIPVAITICDALDYLHNLTPPVVHRDIKPGNIKISPSGQVFLVDFGLAKMAASGEQTLTGAQALTPGYAPPEQYGKGTDCRSDIYALGATMYALLTGKVPVDGLARAFGDEKLPEIRSINPAVTPQVEAAILKAMSVLPEQRYQSVKEFQLALLRAGNLVQGATLPQGGFRIIPPNAPTAAKTVARPISSPSPLPSAEDQKKSKSSLPLIIGGIVIGMLMMLVVTVGVLYFTGVFDRFITGISPTTTDSGVAMATEVVDMTPTLQSSLTQEPSLTPSVPATIQPTPLPTDTEIPTETPVPTETFIPTETNTPTPAYTPIGGGLGQIAFASDRDGLPQIFIMDSDGKNVRKITNLNDGACGPDWSPDGQRLVFQSPCRQYQTDYEGSRLFLVNVDGSGLIPLNSVPGGDYDPAWSPDGKTIAFTSIRSDKRPHIYIYNLEDNTATLITSISSYDRRPVWSPDGQYIAFETTRAGKPEIWFMGKDGSKPKEFSRSGEIYSSMPAWSPNGDTIIFSQGSSLPWLASKSFSKIAEAAVKVSDVRPIFDADFSPDGIWVVFHTLQDVSIGNRDIYIMLATGGSLTRLTTEESADFHPSWY